MCVRLCSLHFIRRGRNTRYEVKKEGEYSSGKAVNQCRSDAIVRLVLLSRVRRERCIGNILQSESGEILYSILA